MEELVTTPKYIFEQQISTHMCNIKSDVASKITKNALEKFTCPNRLFTVVRDKCISGMIYQALRIIELQMTDTVYRHGKWM